MIYPLKGDICCQIFNTKLERTPRPNRLQQAAAVGSGGCELGFELLAQGHEFISFSKAFYERCWVVYRRLK